MNADLMTAWEAHQTGRYADAARTYQALLDRDPDDPDVLHLFGVMHHQCGYSARAAELTAEPSLAGVRLEALNRLRSAIVTTAHRALSEAPTETGKLIANGKITSL